MSLLLSQLTPAAPSEPLIIDGEPFPFHHIEADGEELSFHFGPLPDDVIAAVDLLVNVFDDTETPDDFDYSFSFTLLEDAQVYALAFETEETPDETDHSFATGPLSDDFVAPDEKVYGLQVDDDPGTDETDHSFTFTLLEDAQIYGLAFDDDASTDTADYDFSLSLQDDIVIVADEPPYQHFDEYDENFEGEEYSFYLGAIGDDEIIVPPVTGQGDGDIVRRKGTKPIVTVRPKAERDLDDVLELISEVSADQRVSENKKTVKAALTAIKAVEAPTNYKPAITAIQKALTKVSRATAKHEGLQQAIARISLDLETLIAEMERNRKRRRREEEEIILWLALT